MRIPSYANVMSTVAVVLAMGGGGVALASHLVVRSSDIVDGAVKARHIASEAVTGPKLRSDAVTSGKLRDGDVKASDVGLDAIDGGKVADATLTGADVDFGSLTGADIADGTLGGTDVANESIGGIDIDENSLAQVPAAALGGIGRESGTGTCDPESATFASCASVAVTRFGPGPARALVIGRIVAHNEQDADSGVGACRLRSSGGGTIAGTTQQVLAEDGHAFIVSSEYLTLTGVTAPLNPGTQTFTLECNQDSSTGAIRYSGASVTAVMISAS